ncbi:MAG: hypothetical protein IPM34_11545 [Saprospiraceae bacterium]|nr:hypothetical protein [Saprospiraceae bacterium]
MKTGLIAILLSSAVVGAGISTALGFQISGDGQGSLISDNNHRKSEKQSGKKRAVLNTGIVIKAGSDSSNLRQNYDVSASQSDTFMEVMEEIIIDVEEPVLSVDSVIIDSTAYGDLVKEDLVIEIDTSEIPR